MEKQENKKSALSVTSGVPQPEQINPQAVSRLKSKKKLLPAAEVFYHGILAGDRTLLSQAITLVESSLPAHSLRAQEVISLCLPHSGRSIRIGITGIPGVGKSTFIESFGSYLSSRGKKLAVLAIDPSSEKSKGSILGDKTRMEKLAVDPNAFIRPSPTSGSLGGVARKTRESILLCEAAGFDTIFIETVGVGQSETAVHSMVDFFLLLMIPGAGDELQGIKRGIMEMADAIAINKAEGPNLDRANLAKAEFESALQLFPATESGWEPKVLTCSALSMKGIPQIWQLIEGYWKTSLENGYFHKKRNHQGLYWMNETIREELLNSFYRAPGIEDELKEYQKQILNNEINSYLAAKNLLERYFSKQNIREGLG
jgi:LAO/AO transport system kinase